MDYFYTPLGICIVTFPKHWYHIYLCVCTLLLYILYIFKRLKSSARLMSQNRIYKQSQTYEQLMNDISL